MPQNLMNKIISKRIFNTTGTFDALNINLLNQKISIALQN